MHVCARFLKFVTPPPEAEYFFNEYETLKILININSNVLGLEYGGMLHLVVAMESESGIS